MCFRLLWGFRSRHTPRTRGKRLTWFYYYYDRLVSTPYGGAVLPLLEISVGFFSWSPKCSPQFTKILLHFDGIFDKKRVVGYFRGLKFPKTLGFPKIHIGNAGRLLWVRIAVIERSHSVVRRWVETQAWIILLHYWASMSRVSCTFDYFHSNLTHYWTRSLNWSVGNNFVNYPIVDCCRVRQCQASEPSFVDIFIQDFIIL